MEQQKGGNRLLAGDGRKAERDQLVIHARSVSQLRHQALGARINMADTFTRIGQIIESELNRARVPAVCPEIRPDTSFERDLNASTIDMICLSIEFEDAFEIEFPAERLENCDTVASLVDLVDDLVQKKAEHYA